MLGIEGGAAGEDVAATLGNLGVIWARVEGADEGKFRECEVEPGFGPVQRLNFEIAQGQPAVLTGTLAPLAQEVPSIAEDSHEVPILRRREKDAVG